MLTWFNKQLQNEDKIKLSPKYKRRNDRRKHSKITRMSLHLASAATGVSEGALRRWRLEYGKGTLRDGGDSGGRRARTEASQKKIWRPLFEWADQVCEQARLAGEGLTWRDIAEKLLANDELVQLAQDLVLQQHEHDQPERVTDQLANSRPSSADPSGVLERLRLSDVVLVKGSQEMTLDRMQWRLKRLLSKLGFSWDILMKDSIQALTRNPEWIVRFCMWQWNFLSNPDLSTFLVYMDESFCYEGASQASGIVAPGRNEAEQKGSFRRIGIAHACLYRWELLDFSEVPEQTSLSFLQKAFEHVAPPESKDS